MLIVGNCRRIIDPAQSDAFFVLSGVHDRRYRAVLQMCYESDFLMP